MLIVDRGRPVARLEPVHSMDAEDDDRLGSTGSRRHRPAGAWRFAEGTCGGQAAAGQEERIRGGARFSTSVAKADEIAGTPPAIVPLVMAEPTTRALQKLAAARNPAMLVWWATPVECTSAIARLERDGGLDPARGARGLRPSEAPRRWLARSGRHRRRSRSGPPTVTRASAARRGMRSNSRPRSLPQNADRQRSR